MPLPCNGPCWTARCGSLRAAGRRTETPEGEACRPWVMDLLTAFGLHAVTAMLICYALEDRSHWFSLAFGGLWRPVFVWRALDGRRHVRAGRHPFPHL